MPDEVLNLLIIAVLKSYAAKFNVRKITVDSTEGSLELPSINSLKDKRLTAALDKYAVYDHPEFAACTPSRSTASATTT